MRPQMIGIIVLAGLVFCWINCFCDQTKRIHDNERASQNVYSVWYGRGKELIEEIKGGIRPRPKGFSTWVEFYEGSNLKFLEVYWSDPKEPVPDDLISLLDHEVLVGRWGNKINSLANELKQLGIPEVKKATRQSEGLVCCLEKPGVVRRLRVKCDNVVNEDDCKKDDTIKVCCQSEGKNWFEASRLSCRSGGGREVVPKNQCEIVSCNVKDEYRIYSRAECLLKGKVVGKIIKPTHIR